MSQYIEREKLLKLYVDGKYDTADYHVPVPVIIQNIKDIPAADVRPVVRATWKRIDFKPCGHDYECSSCGWKNDMATHFCPNCGARMEE